ncbi:MAG: hypothetical protein U0R19_35345 [Bryobacteraceae bacterium]
MRKTLTQIAFALCFTCLLFPQGTPKESKRQQQQNQRRQNQEQDSRAEERRRREQTERTTNVYADTATHRYYRSRCDGSPGLIVMSLWDAKQQRFTSASCKDR